MDNITENNMIALLEECVVNGDKSPQQLWAWFMGERELIEQTIKDANYYLDRSSRDDRFHYCNTLRNGCDKCQ